MTRRKAVVWSVVTLLCILLAIYGYVVVPYNRFDPESVSESEPITVSRDARLLARVVHDTSFLDEWKKSIGIRPTFRMEVWDLDVGTCKVGREVGTGYANAVAFAPDGRRLAVSGQAGRKGFLLEVDAATGRVLRRGSGAPHLGRFLQYAPSGEYLLCVGAMPTERLYAACGGPKCEVQFQVWAVAGWRRKCQWRTGNKETDVETVAISPDSKRAVLSAGSVRRTDTMLLVDFESCLVREMNVERNRYHVAAFDSSGRRVAFYWSDGRVVYWDLTA